MAAIERATLINIARDTATHRMAARRSLLSAYVAGSVAANEPLLGDATDIDLILIDAEPPPLAREIIPLTEQVVLDIQTRHQSEYANPKTLRVHPWRGPEMCEPLFINDPRHVFELAQASARGQFHRADFVAARARAFLALARDNLHVTALPGAAPTAPVTFGDLCLTLLHTANAAITLTGFPGAGRRLMLKLEVAARKLGRADLYDEMMAIIGPAQVERPLAEALLAQWSAAYRQGQTEAEELIHPARRAIYERGFQALIQADRAAEGLWLLLFTWQALVKHLSTTSAHAEAWAHFLNILGMADPDSFHARGLQARAYLDLVTDAVEQWAEKNGA
jgi:hypothetical protein